MASVKHICPEPDNGMMPMIIHKFAGSGNVAKIMSWLEKGGDINAADISSATMVHIACENNQVELLKKLLERPDVHLNQKCSRYQPSSPLELAINRGNVECIELLLTAQSECQVLLNKGLFVRKDNNFLTGVRPDAMLDSVNVLLKHGYVLDEDEALHIMQAAVNCSKPRVIDAVAEHDFPITRTGKIPLKEVYQKKLCSENTIERIFKRAVDSKNDHALGVLGAVLVKRDWKTLESLLKLVQEKVMLNIDLAEGTLARDIEKVKKLLAEPENLTEDILNGVLLVAAIGGTSEEVMEVMLKLKPQYPAEILNESMILACLHNQIVVLVSLFKEKSLSLTILDRAAAVAPRSPVESLIKHAIKRTLQDSLPIKEGYADEKEDDSDESQEDIPLFPIINVPTNRILIE